MMAKTEKTAEKRKSNLPERPSFEYNAQTLADDLGIEPASVRVALRKAGIEKNQGVYGWSKKSEYQEVLKTLKSKGDSTSTEKASKGKDTKGKDAKASSTPAKAKKDKKAA